MTVYLIEQLTEIGDWCPLFRQGFAFTGDDAERVLAFYLYTYPDLKRKNHRIGKYELKRTKGREELRTVLAEAVEILRALNRDEANAVEGALTFLAEHGGRK